MARIPCDLVLLDYRLPGLDGLGVLRYLRDENPEVRVIGLSSSASERVGEQFRAAGAEACFRKEDAAGLLRHLAQG